MVCCRSEWYIVVEFPELSGEGGIHLDGMMEVTTRVYVKQLGLTGVENSRAKELSVRILAIASLEDRCASMTNRLDWETTMDFGL